MEFDLVQWAANALQKLFFETWGWPEFWTNFTLQLIGAVVVAGVIMVIFIFLTWVERKGAARFQDRIGPNRVGPKGLLQPIADAIKMVTKEDTTPKDADKVFYNLAPILSVFSVIMIWAVIPWTTTWLPVDINVGVIYISAVGSFGIIGILMAGWSSKNKYALVGAVRGVAQLVSYEIPLFLAMLVPVFLAGSMGINDIIQAQSGGIQYWFIWMAPLAALIYLVSSLAEIGRAPFDLLEAESEIVAGYHIEYSGMKFGLFQAAEFTHTFTAAAVMSILFFGGWNVPWANENPNIWVGLIFFLIKTSIFYLVIIWSRMTFPRVRIDQLMNLNWKFMVPVSLIMVMGIPILKYLLRGQGFWLSWTVYLVFGLVLGFGSLLIAGRSARKNQKARLRFPERPVAVPPKEETSA
jgi:NADH-quinone oxidoreductase subunit H